MFQRTVSLTIAFVLLFASVGFAQEKIKVLIVEGQNNHDWKATTPVLVKALTEARVFDVDVATSPGRGGDMSTFKPNFSAYDAVVSNYNGEPWSAETQKAFINYVKHGGGFVVVHAANNSFGDWKEYNEIIGLGGWAVAAKNTALTSISRTVGSSATREKAGAETTALNMNFRSLSATRITRSRPICRWHGCTPWMNFMIHCEVPRPKCACWPPHHHAAARHRVGRHGKSQRFDPR